MGASCEKTGFQSRWYRKSLLLANNKGTDRTAMMSKPAYLSVEILTDKPTSGKVSIPQLVSVAEHLPGRKPSILFYVIMFGVSTLHFAVFVICTLLLKIYIMSRTGSEFMYTNVIISSSLKPYQNFGPDLSPDCDQY